VAELAKKGVKILFGFTPGRDATRCSLARINPQRVRRRELVASFVRGGDEVIFFKGVNRCRVARPSKGKRRAGRVARSRPNAVVRGNVFAGGDASRP